MTLVASSPAQAAASVYHTALLALSDGISCLPIVADGTKRPAVTWKAYQKQLPTSSDVRRWFHGKDRGIAVITGQISSGLEALDFDTRDIYHAWARRMGEKGLTLLLERLERGYLEESPSGIHLLYRCACREGNQKLARRHVAGSKHIISLIETRGEGGYVIVAPSGGQVHPSGKPYRLVRGGIGSILMITQQERHDLLALARTFDELLSTSVPVADKLPVPAERRSDSLRPGDRYNQAIAWETLLPLYGWELVRSVGGQGWWRRPGKDGPGVSATTNYADSDLLYVFSTSTCFEPGRGYSKFAAYAYLAHRGDFTAAARALIRQGYSREKGQVD